MPDQPPASVSIRNIAATRVLVMKTRSSAEKTRDALYDFEMFTNIKSHTA